jgi:nicotinamide-nucleotide amidase
MMFDDELVAAAARVLDECRARGFKLVTAESCTGGLIAACLTEIPGSSDVVDRAFVTYSNPAKAQTLGVPAALIAGQGAVSEEVARAMAAGALERSGSDLAVACTGIAGPGGGSGGKPVGLVHIAAARAGGAALHRRHEFGDLGRSEVRRRTVAAALALVAELLDEAAATHRPAGP